MSERERERERELKSTETHKVNYQHTILGGHQDIENLYVPESSGCFLRGGGAVKCSFGKNLIQRHLCHIPVYHTSS